MTTAERVDAQLRGIVSMVDSAGRKSPPQTALDGIRSLAVDALQMLKETDPVMQRIGTAVLVIKRCTEVRTRRGTNESYTAITNRAIFDWAVAEIHRLHKE